METFIFIALLLMLLSYVYLKIAIRFKIIDKPNQRSSHTKPTIRGGGIIFVFALWLFFVLNNYQYPYFLLGVTMISIISFLDDIYTLSSKIRLPFQFLAILLVLIEVDMSFIPLYLFLFYLVFGVGIVNMFNFMDGINGITGIFSLVVLFGFYLINSIEQLINVELIYFTMIALVIFGFYNFRKKALFFAGDIGSISIGVLIFFMGVLFTIKLNSPLILLFVIVYGGDASCTILYRKIFTKESLLKPHRHHIYQKLVDNGKYSHLFVSFMYAMIQLLVNIVVLYSYSLDLTSQLIIFSGLVLLFTLLYLFLYNKYTIKVN